MLTAVINDRDVEILKLKQENDRLMGILIEAISDSQTQTDKNRELEDKLGSCEAGLRSNKE